MKSFETIRALRDDLTGAGGHIVAPCPHQRDCPIAENDWRHFAPRFERSSLHRQIKGSEKYQEQYRGGLGVRSPLDRLPAKTGLV